MMMIVYFVTRRRAVAVAGRTFNVYIGFSDECRFSADIRTSARFSAIMMMRDDMISRRGAHLYSL